MGDGFIFFWIVIFSILLDQHWRLVCLQIGLLGFLSDQNERNLWYEYSSGETLDAQFAKAFDKLQFLNELIKLWDHKEYNWALKHYRKYFIPFPELLDIIDNPTFSTIRIEA